MSESESDKREGDLVDATVSAMKAVADMYADGRIKGADGGAQIVLAGLARVFEKAVVRVTEARAAARTQAERIMAEAMKNAPEIAPGVRILSFNEEDSKTIVASGILGKNPLGGDVAAAVSRSAEMREMLEQAEPTPGCDCPACTALRSRN